MIIFCQNYDILYCLLLFPLNYFNVSVFPGSASNVQNSLQKGMEDQRNKVNEKNKESHEIKSREVTRSASEEGKQNLLDDADSNIRNVGEWNVGGETNLIFGGDTELHVGDGREFKQNIINEAELEFGDGMQANSMNDEELMVVGEEKQNVEDQLNISRL